MVAKKFNKTKDWVYSEYVVKHRTIRDISQECGVSSSVVNYHIKKFGIERAPVRRYFDDGKLCADCNIVLSLSLFHKKPGNSDGRHHRCNKCFQQRYKNLRKNYRARPDIKSKMNKTSSKWIQANKKQHNNNVRNHWQRIKDLPGTKLTNTVRSQICHSLNGQKAGRHWETLVGYTVDDLRQHLEQQFEPWMSWNNYGQVSLKCRTWQIDHRRPVSSFKIVSAECNDFKECWAINNLRPLEAIANIKKGNKY